jgi:hypothetical protein
MKCCIRNRWFASKEFLSQVIRDTAITGACAALILFAQPVLAQRGGRGGSHAGGSFGGGHSRGFASGHASGGRSYGGMRGSSYSSARGGRIEVFSGAGSRGGYARSEYEPGGSGSYYAEESRGNEVHDGIVSYSGGVRHTTIGFPRTGGSWQVPESAYRSGAALDFAGQGRAVWESSPRQMRERSSAGAEALSSRPRREWTPREQRGERYGGDRDFDRDRLPDRFRRPFYPYGGYGGFGVYPWLYFGESGFGNWSNCDQWTPDWDWQDEGCENNEPQIVAYGADGIYPAPETVTDARLEEYIQEHPWVGDGSIASEPDGRPSNSEINQPRPSGTALSNRTPDTLLYLADGTNFEVTSYWLSGGELHYITGYGGENAVPIARVDLQRTVNSNTARGVPFTLRPAPHAGSEGGRR